MTAATADEVALCAAIREQPDEDTPRLMLADLLEGWDAEYVKCPQCTPKHKTANGGGLGWLLAGQPGAYFHVPCDVCSSNPRSDGGILNDDNKGSGFVRDASRPLRAELCRVQVELARAHGECSRIGGVTVQSGEYLEALARWDKLRARNAELTARLARDHPELYPKCPACKGCYSARGESVANCATCEQVGRVGSWSRGLLSVPVPTLGAVWEWIRPAHNAGTGTGMSKPKGGWQLTPWARGELLTRPWVCEVPILDREPGEAVNPPKKWYWQYWHEGDSPRHRLPRWLLEAVESVGMHEHAERTSNDHCNLLYPTPDAAKLALARCVARAAFAPGVAAPAPGG